jgi:hypothetical protein
MTYEDIISLGWKDRHPSDTDKKHSTFVYESLKGFDYHIMSAHLGMEEDDGIYDMISIGSVPEKCHTNIWDNSDVCFNGWLKTKDELNLVMQFVGVIKYEDIK